MERTFKENDILLCPPDFQLRKVLVDYAIKCGVPVFKTTASGEKVNDFPDLIFCSDEITGINIRTISSHHNEITLSQFYEYCDNWKICSSMEVILNERYTAKVTAENVVIGDQIFTHETIEKLYQVVKSFNK